MKSLKPEIRILGIDDSPIGDKEEGDSIMCIGTIFRGGNYIDGLLSFNVEKDGYDSTKKIIKAVNKTKHKDQLQVIIIDGITLAGFNIINIKKIYEKTKIPVIVIMRNKPEMKKFLRALENADNGEKRKIIGKTGEPIMININNKKLYIQKEGISNVKVREILLLTCIHSHLPEPIRVSHLIASGIYYGESRGQT